MYTRLRKPFEVANEHNSVLIHKLRFWGLLKISKAIIVFVVFKISSIYKDWEEKSHYKSFWSHCVVL